MGLTVSGNPKVFGSVMLIIFSINFEFFHLRIETIV